VIVPGEGTKVSGSSALMRHSMAWPWKRDVFLGHRQTGAGGDPDLLIDQVDAGDRLRDRMLDLQAGVHLDEVELAVLVEELDVPAPRYFSLRIALAQISPICAGLRSARARVGFFPDLLVAALQRAVALAQVDRVALAVAQHLDLDVAGLPRYFSM
jgi:hypothetical protein